MTSPRRKARIHHEAGSSQLRRKPQKLDHQDAPSPGRKSKLRHHTSFQPDDVSEISSSFGDGNNTSSIFRPKLVPSNDEDDESILLHKAVGNVLDQAMGKKQAYDTDAMTTEEDLLRNIRRTNKHLSIEEDDPYFALSDARESPMSSKNDNLMEETTKHKPRIERQGLMVGSHPSDEESSLRSKLPAETENNGRRGFLWFFLLLLVVACTLGGIAGLVVVLVKGGKTSISSQDEVPRWMWPTSAPTFSPTERVSPSPSLRPSPHPSPYPVVRPTLKPTTASPTAHPTSRPIIVTPIPTLKPTPIATPAPTTSSPTKVLNLKETILLLSPNSATALVDSNSPQSLALKQVENSSSNLETFALYTLFFNNNVTAWDTFSLPCTWMGVTCDADRKIVKLELNHQNLTGTLPSELALATDLQVLSISGSSGSETKSRITGSIPDLWGKLLTNLRVLHLYDNSLSGSIPESMWSLFKLQDLQLDGNLLTGLFPSSLSTMSSLVSFDVSNNKLVGSLPENWSALSNLESLSIQGNLIHGTIPKGLQSLSMLRELHLQENSLRGSLPAEFQFLTNLGWLGLSENLLTGSLPPVWSQVTTLEGLELRNNRIRGTLPPTYSSLLNLRVLDLSKNLLSGSIPTEWDSLNMLAALSLDQNQLVGQVSNALCETVMHIASDCNANIDCSCCTDCYISA